MSADRTVRIRALNDAFRQSGQGGRIVMTQSVSALPEVERQAIMQKVAEFDEFTAENDPHGEHDFGTVEHNNETFFWKIDYFDRAMKYGSEDPSDPEKTTRVLTIMLTIEY